MITIILLFLTLYFANAQTIFVSQIPDYYEMLTSNYTSLLKKTLLDLDIKGQFNVSLVFFSGDYAPSKIQKYTTSLWDETNVTKAIEFVDAIGWRSGSTRPSIAFDLIKKKKMKNCTLSLFLYRFPVSEKYNVDKLAFEDITKQFKSFSCYTIWMKEEDGNIWDPMLFKGIDKKIEF